MIGSPRAISQTRPSKSDYLGALAKWSAMKEWTFVSNYMGVVPAPATKLGEDARLRAAVLSTRLTDDEGGGLCGHRFELLAAGSG
jgi:hypothetical protein